MKNTPSNHAKDDIFAQPVAKTEPFAFNQKVVEVFPDMINRSVPGYATIIESLPKILKSHISPDAVIYDLGCSLGAATHSIASSGEKCTIRAIDYSDAMVERCQQRMSAYNYAANISVEQGDINTLEIEPCDAVVMNFTLQFIAPDARNKVVQKIYDALKPGGCLVLSEKIKAPRQNENQLLIDLHHQFKRENGYSELEISQKRNALENVMILDSLNEHETRLKQSGFTTVTPWFQHFNFVSLMAVKA